MRSYIRSVCLRWSHSLLLVALCLFAVNTLHAEEEVILSPFFDEVSASRNLTEQEIRELPVGVSFESIRQRLRCFTTPGVAVPIIFFEIHEAQGAQCMMGFTSKGDILQFAVVVPRDSERGDDAIVLWPKEYVGRPFSSMLEAHQTKEEKKGEPGATDNPDDAQRLREDH